MDTIDIVTALSEIGLLGAVLLGGGGIFFVMRRNGKNGSNGQHVVDMFVQNQERIATALEGFSQSLVRVEKDTHELVELHIKIEARREVLAELVDKGGHS